MNEVFFDGVRADNIGAHAEALAAVFRRHGIVVLRGFLDGDARFQAYLDELRALFHVLQRKLGVAYDPSADLRELITSVFQADNLYPRYIHDIGTHPMKLVSGNLLKYSAAVLTLTRAIFGSEAMIASPTGSDNLLFFFPGEKFKRYALPMHQDFPYIMQSPEQITVWIPLTEPAPGVGGFLAWPGTHRAGVRANKDGPTGMEVQVPAEELAGIEPVTVIGRPGDVVFSHSLLVHKSVPNTSPDQMRAVQLFRFSDLRSAEAERFFWQSTNYTSPKGSITFAEAFPALLLPADR